MPFPDLDEELVAEVIEDGLNKAVSNCGCCLLSTATSASDMTCWGVWLKGQYRDDQQGMESEC